MCQGQTDFGVVRVVAGLTVGSWQRADQCGDARSSPVCSLATQLHSHRKTRPDGVAREKAGSGDCETCTVPMWASAILAKSTRNSSPCERNTPRNAAFHLGNFFPTAPGSVSPAQCSAYQKNCVVTA